MNLVRFSIIFFSALYATFFINHGFNEAIITQSIRTSARISVVLFLLTFIASPLHTFFKSSLSQLLLKFRSQIGLSFGVSHLFHLGFIIAYGILNLSALKEGRNLLIVGVGAITYAFIIIMMITSYPKYRKKLTAKKWKQIHTVGSWLIFIVFANSYLGRAFSGDLEYLPFAILIGFAFALRVVYLLKKK
jgi:DMSO/TMAO reductase YedYZ heme-binding membrane subunit